MLQACKIALVSGLLITAITACRTKITPLVAPEDPVCKALPIEKNIIGTWHFESTYNTKTDKGTITSGVVTFDAKGNILDTDSLFENHIYGESVTGKVLKDSVVAKTYNAKSRASSRPPGEWVDVYLTTKRGVGTHPFFLVSNECNRIHLRQYMSENNGIGFVLTKQ